MCVCMCVCVCVCVKFLPGHVRVLLFEFRQRWTRGRLTTSAADAGKLGSSKFFLFRRKKFCCVKSSSGGGNQVFSENRHPEKREEKTVQIETRAREVLLRRKTKPNKFFNMVRKLLSKTALDKVHLAAPSTLLVTFASLPSH